MVFKMEKMLELQTFLQRCDGVISKQKNNVAGGSKCELIRIYYLNSL